MPRLAAVMRRGLSGAVASLFGPERYHRVAARVHARRHPPPSLAEVGAIADPVDAFHVLSYTRGALYDTRWAGVPIQKSPLDCWIYQELLYELRPDVVVETGTYLGGSALFFAHLFDLLGHGRVITVDLQDRSRVSHPRITKIAGDSAAADTLARVRAELGSRDKVMVVLDSDHSEAHVARELRAYADLVSVGSYLVVEDTNVNGHPVLPEHGPGPLEAVMAFLREDARFEVDRSREKFLLTYFPGGWLRRIR